MHVPGSLHVYATQCCGRHYLSGTVPPLKWLVGAPGYFQGGQLTALHQCAQLSQCPGHPPELKSSRNLGAGALQLQVYLVE